LSAKGTAAWTLRYRTAGKRKELTLGRYPDISLTKAREIAAARRAEVQQGIDVAAAKRKAEHAAANAWTFRKLADDYFERSPTGWPKIRSMAASNSYAITSITRSAASPLPTFPRRRSSPSWKPPA
jgi:hypothetical protein